MATAPYHVVQRGKSKVWYVWWLDNGKKVWKRISAAEGTLLQQGAPRKTALNRAALIYAQAMNPQSSQAEPASVSMLVPKHIIMTHDDLIRAYRRGREHEWDSLTKNFLILLISGTCTSRFHRAPTLGARRLQQVLSLLFRSRYRRIHKRGRKSRRSRKLSNWKLNSLNSSSHSCKNKSERSWSNY